jgi:hypothetical protein
MLLPILLLFSAGTEQKRQSGAPLPGAGSKPEGIRPVAIRFFVCHTTEDKAYGWPLYPVYPDQQEENGSRRKQ